MINRLSRVLVATLCLAAVSSVRAADKFEVAGVTFTKPDKWVQTTPSSSMRAAQLEIREGSAKADVVFFYFGPGGAGGVAANVDRWLGQFKEPKDQLKSKVEEQTVNGTKVSHVRAEGTYMASTGGFFGPKTEQPDSMLYGVIVEGKQGPIFVKATGPKKIIEGALADARKMVEDALK
jgi:hypothetical protein